MHESSGMSPAAAPGADSAASTSQRAASVHADQRHAALATGYPPAGPWAAGAQAAHAPAGSAADAQASSTWGVLLEPEGAQVGHEVRSLMMQGAALDPLTPAGAPGGAPSPMPQPSDAPWHGATGARVSQGTDASTSQGGELAAAPLDSAGAEPGPQVASTQSMRHDMPPATHGGADARSGMPPAGGPGLGSGPGGEAAERVACQPPAASPAGSLADSLAEVEVRHLLDAAPMRTTRVVCSLALFVL